MVSHSPIPDRMTQASNDLESKFGGGEEHVGLIDYEQATKKVSQFSVEWDGKNDPIGRGRDRTPAALKLIFGVGGIYAAFLYYGSLMEDVFNYQNKSTGEKFTMAWFLQTLEAAANVFVGIVGMRLTGWTRNLPKKMFAMTGLTQVTSKACTTLALANGLSFPVATLAKSGKMAPVMLGSLLLGGAKYGFRDYLQVVAIIGGTAIVSMDKSKSGTANSIAGVFFIIVSLICDGLTGGVQKRLKAEAAEMGKAPKSYDFMFWTNLFMCITAAVVATGLGQFPTGVAYCAQNPVILIKIIKFCICSAVGQSFIFYTIATFDPLVCTTVTTTRKIFSVLLSIFLKGHSISMRGWSGIFLATLGILSDMHKKTTHKKKPTSPLASSNL